MQGTQLRFGSFSDRWTPTTIGQILTIKHGKDYKHLPEGDIPVLGTGGKISGVTEALCNWPCVLIGRKGTINKPQYMDVPFWSVDTLFYSKAKDGQSPKFQYYLFQTIDWLKYNEASGVPSLSAATIEKISVNVPSVDEQQKIAAFFTALDEKIHNLETQLEEIDKFKNGLFGCIFSTKKIKEWNRSKFSQEFEFKRTFSLSRKEISTDKCIDGEEIKIIHYGDILTKYGDIVDPQKDQIGYALTKLSVEDEDYLKDGDIVFADAAEDYSVGKAIEMVGINSGVLSGLHTIAATPKNRFASGYLSYYFNSQIFKKQVKTLSVGTKVMSLTKSAIKTTDIYYPSIEEQEKISSLFSLLDEKRKVAIKRLLLEKQLKKAFMQQMFV